MSQSPTSLSRFRKSAALQQAGITITVLEPIEPSMEDVFVAMIEQEERKAAVNLRRLKTVTRKELLHIVRDVRSLTLALALPLVMLLLFGYALTLDVDRIPTTSTTWPLS